MKLYSLLLDRSVHDLCITEPLAPGAIRIQGAGLAWVFRGLWCGVMVGKRPLWICTRNLEAWAGGGNAWSSTAPISVKDALPARVPKMFPRELVVEELKNADSTSDGVDGVPFAIHKIQDRNARRVALQAFQAHQL